MIIWSGASLRRIWKSWWSWISLMYCMKTVYTELGNSLSKQTCYCQMTKVLSQFQLERSKHFNWIPQLWYGGQNLAFGHRLLDDIIIKMRSKFISGVVPQTAKNVTFYWVWNLIYLVGIGMLTFHKKIIALQNGFDIFFLQQRFIDKWGRCCRVIREAMVWNDVACSWKCLWSFVD